MFYFCLKMTCRCSVYNCHRQLSIFIVYMVIIKHHYFSSESRKIKFIFVYSIHMSRPFITLLCILTWYIPSMALIITWTKQLHFLLSGSFLFFLCSLCSTSASFFFSSSFFFGGSPYLWHLSVNSLRIGLLCVTVNLNPLKADLDLIKSLSYWESIPGNSGSNYYLVLINIYLKCEMFKILLPTNSHRIDSHSLNPNSH